MTYIDGLKYEEYAQDSDKWHKGREVLNFVIIHYQCRRDSIYFTLNVLFGLVLKKHENSIVSFFWKVKVLSKDLLWKWNTIFALLCSQFSL